ncbi:MAG: hypothetical protein N2C14_09060 [Planctomycetales bacterium]
MSSPANQAIAGVSPSSAGETTIMAVWPTVGLFSVGRFFGRIYDFLEDHNVDVGGLVGLRGVLTLRNVVMIATTWILTLVILVPLGLDLVRASIKAFVSALLGLKWPPAGCMFPVYRLTNRRVIVEGFFTGAEMRSVNLDDFDSVELDHSRGGQRWYPAADLVFRSGARETFRLGGVGGANVFQHACLSAHQAYVGVKEALAHQAG